jgi:endonuclease/exonuclease/phosphatase family metal-dependent hydrolase
MTARLRIATYNIEWFTELFSDSDVIVNDSSQSARFGVTKSQQLTAIAAVLRALDADAVMIIEAPDHSPSRSCTRALENFASHFGLRTRAALIGFTSETRQEIALLYDPDVMTAQHNPLGAHDKNSAAPRFDYAYAYDLNGDGIAENIGFSKPPLEVHLHLRSGGELNLIGVHIKSKAAHGAQSRAEFIRISTQNRRKQLAECFWLRGRIDQLVAQNSPLIVLGDFNDGPGLDEYEQMFGYSSVEVVMGTANANAAHLICPLAGSAALMDDQQPPTSARFYLDDPKGYFEALLDYIMISPNLATLGPVWRIWHPLRDAQIIANPPLAKALMVASDHFPVTLDINPPQAAPLP